MRITPVTPRGLRKFDHLPPCGAVIAAWTSTGSNPRGGGAAIAETRAAMPLLARALDRLVQQQEELVDEWMLVTGLSTKETRDLISKIEERIGELCH